MQPAMNAIRDPADDGGNLTRPGYLPPPEPAISDAERYLAGLWASTLGIRPIGRTDDFFALGGGSRDAAAIFARIASERGLTLPLALLVTHPTVAALAGALVAAEPERPAQPDILVPIRPGGGRPPFVVVHGFGGEVVSARALVKPLYPDIPFYGVRAQERLLGKFEAGRGVPQIAAGYIARIRALQPHGPYYLAGYCAGGVIAFEMAVQLRRAGEPVALLMMIDSAFFYAMTPLRRFVHRIRRSIALLRRDGAKGIAASYKRWTTRRAARRQLEAQRAIAGEAKPAAPTRAAQAKAERAAARGVDHSYMPVEYRQQFYALLERYRPPVYEGDVLMVNTPGIIDLTGDESLGWGWRIKGKLRVEIIDTRHNDIMRSPAVERIAALVNEAYGIDQRAPSIQPAASVAAGLGGGKVAAIGTPAAPAE